jgi:phytoene desaturase
MNYADMKLGTWYPEGGMYKIVEGMYNLAKELGVNFLFDQTVNKINFKNNIATSITFINSKKDKTEVQEYHSNVIIGSADYHFIETKLLPENLRSYTKKYWDKIIFFFIGKRPVYGFLK